MIINFAASIYLYYDSKPELNEVSTHHNMYCKIIQSPLIIVRERFFAFCMINWLIFRCVGIDHSILWYRYIQYNVTSINYHRHQQQFYFNKWKQFKGCAKYFAKYQITESIHFKFAWSALVRPLPMFEKKSKVI